MSAPDVLFQLLDRLADSLCERSALKPLRYLLSGYPLSSPHTDGWFALLEALKDIKGLGRDDTTPAEQAFVREALQLLYTRLDAGGPRT
jgi:hypothetical protein